MAIYMGEDRFSKWQDGQFFSLRTGQADPTFVPQASVVLYDTGFSPVLLQLSPGEVLLTFQDEGWVLPDHSDSKTWRVSNSPNTALF
jgi:hypothetical protein